MLDQPSIDPAEALGLPIDHPDVATNTQVVDHEAYAGDFLDDDDDGLGPVIDAEAALFEDDLDEAPDTPTAAGVS